MTGVLAIAGIVAAAYVVGRHRQPTATAAMAAHVPTLVEIDRRLSDLERSTVPVGTARVGGAAGAGVGARNRPIPATRPAPPRATPNSKPYAVAHYEALASQVARERRMADHDARRVTRLERRAATRAPRVPARAGAGASVVPFPARNPGVHASLGSGAVRLATDERRNG